MGKRWSFLYYFTCFLWFVYMIKFTVILLFNDQFRLSSYVLVHHFKIKQSKKLPGEELTQSTYNYEFSLIKQLIELVHELNQNKRAYMSVSVLYNLNITVWRSLPQAKAIKIKYSVIVIINYIMVTMWGESTETYNCLLLLC